MATKLNQVYKCNICGNMIEMVHASVGQLVCCGQPMELQKEKTKDEGFEKHVPVIEKTKTGIKVKIGSIPHPMEKKHYIEWIEILFDDKSDKQFLKPISKPEAEFCVKPKKLTARCWCNVHGFWKSK